MNRSEMLIRNLYYFKIKKTLTQEEIDKIENQFSKNVNKMPQPNELSFDFFPPNKFEWIETIKESEDLFSFL
jgi:hypothetical protein